MTVNTIEVLIKRMTKLRNSVMLGRPGLDEWLADLGEEEARHSGTQGRMDRVRPANWGPQEKIFDKVKRAKFSTMDAPPGVTIRGLAPKGMLNLELGSGLRIPKPHELPDYASLWNKDQKKACDVMAAWFAQWASAHATEFRIFIIISMISSHLRIRWKKKYNHLWIMSPTEYLRYEFECSKRANETRKDEPDTSKSGTHKSQKMANANQHKNANDQSSKKAGQVGDHEHSSGGRHGMTILRNHTWQLIAIDFSAKSLSQQLREKFIADGLKLDKEPPGTLQEEIDKIYRNSEKLFRPNTHVYGCECKKCIEEELRYTARNMMKRYEPQIE